MYRWRRFSENPMVKYLGLFVFSSVPIMAVFAFMLFRGTGIEWIILPALVLVLVVDVIAYLMIKRIFDKVPDNMNRLYKVSFDEATERLEGAMTEAGVKFMRYSKEEYPEAGLIEDLRGSPYSTHEPSWIYQLDGTRAVILSRVEYPRGHSSLTLLPYEDEGIYLMDKVKEVADRALGP
jgi:hypothetical protein